MSQFSIELAAEKINDPRTKDYFREVLSSFVNGNNRSAVVMLWSVVVADLVFKLQNLRDLYQDNIAASILTDIEAKQNANPNSPEWEPFLLDDINKKTKLLEPAEYQNLLNLHKNRHLSAHPILTSTNLLFSPNKESTRALIRNALEATLLKPPIFSKRIVTEFVTDIASKKELLPDQDALQRYLGAKYFDGLHISVEAELIKSLWKFCFLLENPDTDANRDINTRALELLYKRSPFTFKNLVLQFPDYFGTVASAGHPLKRLVLFLSDHELIYNALNEAAKVIVLNFAKTDINLLVAATFLSDSMESHIDLVKKQEYLAKKDISEEAWLTFIEMSRGRNLLQEALEIGVLQYCESGAFNSADIHFAKFVESHIDEYDVPRLALLLKGIEENPQTYRRGRATIDHPKIAERVKKTALRISDFPKFENSLS